MLRVFSFILGILGLWFCVLGAMFIPADMFVHVEMHNVMFVVLKTIGVYAPSVACVLIVAALVILWRNAHRASGYFFGAIGFVALSVFCAVVLRMLTNGNTFEQAAYVTLISMGAITTFPMLVLLGSAMAAYLSPKFSVSAK